MRNWQQKLFRVFVSASLFVLISLSVSASSALAESNWGTCSWVGVERAGINSHQPGKAWCPAGSFMVSFDLDADNNAAPSDSPVIGQVQCCDLDGFQGNGWDSCSWEGVEKAGINSHQPEKAWCENGDFLVSFDLDGNTNVAPSDAPLIGQAQCCGVGGIRDLRWSSCSWVGVETAGIRSHQPGKAWCPDGSFLVAFDLDGSTRISAHDAPIIGQVLCCDPSIPASIPVALDVSHITVANGKTYVFQQGLRNGEKIYLDRSFTYDAVPSSLQGLSYIMTANDDKFSKDSKFLSFSVNTDVTVYVAHSRIYRDKPAWLFGFSKTGMTIEGEGTIPGPIVFDLYERDYPKGTITLGGNIAPDETQNHAMYTVIIGKQ